jgi:hypothetical protein
MLFFAKLSSLRDTRLTNPPSFFILFNERLRILRCSSLDKPLTESIWLLEIYNYIKPSPSRPPISSNKFSERSRIRSALFFYRPFIADILFELSFKTLKDLCLLKSGITVIRLLLRSRKSKCKGIYLMSKTVLSWLLVAFIEVRNFKPLRCFNVFKQL